MGKRRRLELHSLDSNWRNWKRHFKGLLIQTCLQGKNWLCDWIWVNLVFKFGFKTGERNGGRENHRGSHSFTPNWVQLKLMQSMRWLKHQIRLRIQFLQQMFPFLHQRFSQDNILGRMYQTDTILDKLPMILATGLIQVITLHIRLLILSFLLQDFQLDSILPMSHQGQLHPRGSCRQSFQIQMTAEVFTHHKEVAVTPLHQSRIVVVCHQRLLRLKTRTATTTLLLLFLLSTSSSEDLIISTIAFSISMSFIEFELFLSCVAARCPCVPNSRTFLFTITSNLSYVMSIEVKQCISLCNSIVKPSFSVKDCHRVHSKVLCRPWRKDQRVPSQIQKFKPPSNFPLEMAPLWGLHKHQHNNTISFLKQLYNV